MKSTEFSRSYVTFAAPALLIWAFNFAGILDGFKLSGVSGLTGALPYVTSAVALLFASNSNDIDAGAVTGIGITFGYLATIALQFFALSKTKHAPNWVYPQAQEVKVAAIRGANTLVSTLPGQLFFRAQVLLCGLFLGPHVTALMLYARQISAACSQLIGFLRRVEFPALVQTLRTGSKSPIKETFRTQRLGTIVAVVATILLLAISTFVMLNDGSGNFADAAFVLIIFGPGVLTGAIYLTVVQAFYAMGRYFETAIVAVIASAAATLLSYILPHFTGIAGFALAELSLHLIGLAMLLSKIRSWRRIN